MQQNNKKLLQFLKAKCIEVKWITTKEKFYKEICKIFAVLQSYGPRPQTITFRNVNFGLLYYRNMSSTVDNF